MTGSSAPAGHGPIAVAVALDGEPLVETARTAAVRHPGELVAALRSAAANVGAGAVRVAVAIRDREAQETLARVLEPGELLVVPAVIGAGSPASLGERLAAPVHAWPADELVGEPLVTVAGAVASPGVFTITREITVAELVVRAGGATVGPSWVAVASTLAPRALERDEPLAEGTRAIIVLAGDSLLARRARGDIAGIDPTLAHGVDPAWLGAGFTPGPSSPLSIALVTRRLGLAPS